MDFPADTPAALPVSRTSMIVLGVLVAAVAAGYWPMVLFLGRTWWEEPNYSHGFLVAPLAAYILWRRRESMPAARPSLVGWGLLVAVLGFRAYCFERNEKWIESATLPVLAIPITLALGGWRRTLWAAPGLLFLFFMLPLPQWVNMTLAGPLQTLATYASAAVLGATGLPIVREGHILYVGVQPLEVARACNGLSMLLSFVTLVAALAILADDRPAWERVVLLLSCIPIALLANVIRIAATAWCYHLFGKEFGDHVAHAGAGWAMMPLGLLLAWVELRVLHWVVVEESHTTNAQNLIIRHSTPRREDGKP